MSKKYLVLTGCKEGEAAFKGVFNSRKEAILFIVNSDSDFYTLQEQKEAVKSLIKNNFAGDRSSNYQIVKVEPDLLEPQKVASEKIIEHYLDTELNWKVEKKKLRMAEQDKSKMKFPNVKRSRGVVIP